MLFLFVLGRFWLIFLGIVGLWSVLVFCFWNWVFFLFYLIEMCFEVFRLFVSILILVMGLKVLFMNMMPLVLVMMISSFLFGDYCVVEILVLIELIIFMWEWRLGFCEFCLWIVMMLLFLRIIYVVLVLFRCWRLMILFIVRLGFGLGVFYEAISRLFYWISDLNLLW